MSPRTYRKDELLSHCPRSITTAHAVHCCHNKSNEAKLTIETRDIVVRRQRVVWLKKEARQGTKKETSRTHETNDDQSTPSWY